MLTNGGSNPGKSVLSHGWRAENGFIPYNYDFYSEAILLVLAGLGAPINPLPEIAWAAINRPKASYRNFEFIEAAPIFIHQMPMGYFNLANQRDFLGYDYWVSSTNAIKAHRQYCMDNAAKSRTYAEGYWGLNASDGPDGYVAYGAPGGPDDGTISPTGAISSITFLPDAAVAISNALFERLGKNLWGRYGFSNAINLDRNWFDRDVIGIDLGMALLAIENYRTGLIWNLMRSHESIRRGLQAAGFRSTSEPAPRPVHEGQNHKGLKT
jgi:hypothetical protein